MDVLVTGYGPQLQFFRNGGEFQFVRVEVTTPGYIDMVAQGDYDGDGDIDFVCASSSAGGAYNFLRNNGSFNFTISTKTFPAFSQYTVNGDFDGDGDVDIAISSGGTSILRNDGTVSFTNIPSVAPASILAAADVDEDGDLDLLSSTSLNSVRIHRNLGELQFETIGTGNQRTDPMLASDFDGDGREDIAVLSSLLNYTIRVHTNKDAPTFSLMTSFVTHPLTSNFASWDYDGDGDADIAAWSSETGRFTFFENRQDFSAIVLSDVEHDFSAVIPDSTSRWTFFVSNTGTIPLVIDSIMTRDASFGVDPAFLSVPPGDSAAVTISFAPTAFRAYIDKVFLYSNDVVRPVVRITVTGKAYQRVAEVITPASHDPAGIGDTVVIRLLHPVDVASIAGASIRVHGSVTGVHQNSHRYDETRQLLTVIPAGRFSAGERVTVTLMNNFQFAGGVPVLSPFFTSFIARATEGTMTFSRMTMMYGGPEQDALCSADFDNNGTSDIAFTRSLTKTLNFVRVNGPYLYERLPEIFLPIAVTDLRPGDMDGDGLVDLVIYSPGSMDIYLNKGGFSFTRWWVGAIPESKGLAVADLDGDGALDFVTVNVTSGTVQIFYHVNDKWLRYTKVDYPIGAAEPQQIETGDIDNDGDIDIILGKMGGANIVLMINDGDQTFHAVPLPNATSHAQTIWTADFDADGWLDIALDRSDENSVLVLRNRHDLTFDVVAQPRVTYDPLFLVGGDYDADGDCDLIASNNSVNPTIAKYRNDSLHLTQIGDFPTGAGSSPMITSDFDGNGSVDVAFIDQKILALVILQNRKAVPFTLIHDSLDFGDVHVGTSRTRQVFVLNVSPSAITIDSIRTYVSQFQWHVDTTTISPGDSASITVTFSPTENGWMGIMLAIFIQGEEPVYRNMTGTGVGGTGVERIGEDVPKVFALLQNYPNPFNPATQILFDVPKESRVRMQVFDLRGREVGSVVDAACSPGTYAYTFRADGLVSGVYFYRMSAVPVGNPLRSVFQSTKKMLILK
ncbi:MAG TPA: hypothetical protein DCX46_07435 [Bacteroidetes bacterium]|nr:hypothetical protein [Bacteroidota bacterium]